MVRGDLDYRQHDTRRASSCSRAVQTAHASCQRRHSHSAYLRIIWERAHDCWPDERNPHWFPGILRCCRASLF
jgi:hypothetical protein